MKTRMMKLKKIAVLITVLTLSCQTLAGCGSKETGVVPEQITEDENSLTDEVSDENETSDTDVTEQPNESVTEEEENLETIENEKPSSADSEIETVTPETEDQKENPSDNENNSSTGKEDTKKPNKEDQNKPDNKDDKKPGKEEGKKPDKDKEESDRTDKEEGSQSESSSPEEENEKNDKISAVLTDEFAANVTGAGSSEELAENIAANEKLSSFNLVVMPVKEGYLNGFDNEITGFDEAAMFSPMIGSIPFVAYIFKTSDTDSLVSALKSNANLKWNICTSADEMTVKVSGDYVLFAMTPATFDE